MEGGGRLKSEPSEVLNYRVHVTDVLSSRVGVIEPQVTYTMVLGRYREVEAYSFGMPNV